MAQNNSLADTIQMMIDNVEDAAYDAALKIRKQIEIDFQDMAKGLVGKYYKYKNGSYTKNGGKRGRQYNLYNIYDVTTKVIRGKKSVDIQVDLNFDPSVLEGVYHSNHSEKWKNVEADYVFKNFMEGVHPWTNGWPLWGTNELEYREIKASPKVEPAVKKYKKVYGDKYFNNYVDKALMKLIKSYS